MARFSAIRVAAVTLLMLCGCRQEPEALTVVGWGGSSQEAHRRAYWQSFTASTGIPVREASWHGGIDVLRRKALDRSAHWDLVQVETEDLLVGCAEGLFEPIDWAALGGRGSFIDAATNDCGVGTMQWSYLMGYDGDRISGAGPQTWADFWDVRRFPGLRGMRKTPKYSLEFALLADGVGREQVYPLLRTEQGVERAFRKLDQLKDHILWWTSISEVPDLLLSGKVALSVTSPGRLIVANRTTGRHLRVQWRDNIYAVDYWAILKSSPRKAEAQQLLEYMMRPANQIQLARLIPTGLTNKAAIAAVDPKLEADTPSNSANMGQALALDGDFWVEYGDRLTQRFNAWVAH